MPLSELVVRSGSALLRVLRVTDVRVSFRYGLPSYVCCLRRRH